MRTVLCCRGRILTFPRALTLNEFINECFKQAVDYFDCLADVTLVTL